VGAGEGPGKATHERLRRQYRWGCQGATDDQSIVSAHYTSEKYRWGGSRYGVAHHTCKGPRGEAIPEGLSRYRRCAARARSAAACTSAGQNTVAVPRKAPVAGSWHGMEEGENGGRRVSHQASGHMSSNLARPSGSRTRGMDG
jgi:hypothetical protein